MSQTVSLLSA